MNVLSLFDGISIARLALKNLNIDCTYYASEIDKHAIKQTQLNFPNTIQLGSVVDVDVSKYRQRSSMRPQGQMRYLMNRT